MVTGVFVAAPQVFRQLFVHVGENHLEDEMKVKEKIRQQATINNYNTLTWFSIFSLAVLILAIADALPWVWLPAVVCLPIWLVSHYFLHPTCPFCKKIPASLGDGVVANFCEICGESFDRELGEKQIGLKHGEK